jgi:rhodanese-related sulfurtransferase
MLHIEEIDVHQLASMMQAEPEGFSLVDVRSPAEMAQGVLPNAEPVPMHLVPLKMEEWRNKQHKVVFYCRTGARSGQVCSYLQQQGVAEVINLRGGIVDWHRQGYAVETPEPSRLAG